MAGPIHGDNSLASQRSRLLDALRKKPLTTIEVRRTLDILHPGARIKELRDAGNLIVTFWTHDFTSGGRRHRVGKYVLMPGRPA